MLPNTSDRILQLVKRGWIISFEPDNLGDQALLKVAKPGEHPTGIGLIDLTQYDSLDNALDKLIEADTTING